MSWWTSLLVTLKNGVTSLPLLLVSRMPQIPLRLHLAHECKRNVI